MYFPHGISHHIGLDVHDNGAYETFEAGMVITVEPGVYIPDGSNCDKKWWGIAVRIEDCVLIKATGEPELLSDLAPRRSDEIEELMKQSSVLDQLVLPNLNEEEN
jgi:Xaa-Pro aminopeptidase